MKCAYSIVYMCSICAYINIGRGSSIGRACGSYSISHLKVASSSLAFGYFCFLSLSADLEQRFVLSLATNDTVQSSLYSKQGGAPTGLTCTAVLSCGRTYLRIIDDLFS